LVAAAALIGRVLADAVLIKKVCAAEEQAASDALTLLTGEFRNDGHGCLDVDL
jgi:hypothetical protein